MSGHNKIHVLFEREKWRGLEIHWSTGTYENDAKNTACHTLAVSHHIIWGEWNVPNCTQTQTDPSHFIAPMMCKLFGRGNTMSRRVSYYQTGLWREYSTVRPCYICWFGTRELKFLCRGKGREKKKLSLDIDDSLCCSKATKGTTLRYTDTTCNAREHIIVLWYLW